MKETLSHSQKAYMEMSPEVRRCYDTIFRGKNKLEELKKEETGIHTDMRVAQDLLSLILRDKYESEGFVKDAEVLYGDTKHKLVTIFFSSESLTMEASIHPAPKKVFERVYVDSLKLVKRKKKAK